MSIKMEFIASKVFLLVGNTGGILDNSWVYSTSYDVTFFFIRNNCANGLWDTEACKSIARYV